MRAVTKWLKACLVGLAAWCGGASAQIPVTDIAHITLDISDQAQTIAQWVQQFQYWESQIQQMQAQMQAISGARGMGLIFNNPSISQALPQDWQTLVSSVQSMPGYATNRANYPTMPADWPAMNHLFDTLAGQKTLMSTLYSQANERINQINSLMTQIENAPDPAAKQDLANRLINEQNEVQADVNLSGILKDMQQKDLQEAGNAAATEYQCHEFKHPGC
jgi:type IV secretion system protein VirB5